MSEVTSSLHAFKCLCAQINPYAEEVWILALNSQLALIKKEMIFRGTADYCMIHPRDIFRTLIMCNASSFILAHNHPSNQYYPSNEDLVLTHRIYQLSLLLQIPLNDHIILTTSHYYSMADHNHFKKWRRKKSQIFY